LQLFLELEDLVHVSCCELAELLVVQFQLGELLLMVSLLLFLFGLEMLDATGKAGLAVLGLSEGFLHGCQFSTQQLFVIVELSDTGLKFPNCTAGQFNLTISVELFLLIIFPPVSECLLNILQLFGELLVVESQFAVFGL
jgi:hypothetical protein